MFVEFMRPTGYGRHDSSSRIHRITGLSSILRYGNPSICFGTKRVKFVRILLSFGNIHAARVFIQKRRLPRIASK